MPDLIHELGPLALATRLKRLSDRLYRDISQTYRELDVDFEPRWFPVLYELARNEGVAVTDLAARVGLSHPAVNQVAGAMRDAGILESTRDDDDNRRHLLTLTARGRALASDLEPVWERVASASRGLLDEAAPDLIPTLDAIEEALDRTSMHRRVAALDD